MEIFITVLAILGAISFCLIVFFASLALMGDLRIELIHEHKREGETDE